jgi:uncharacterized membrane protein YesL
MLILIGLIVFGISGTTALVRILAVWEEEQE